MMATLWQDLRFAARILRKSPGFAVVTILALALGIGANATMFSVVNAVLLRPLSFPEPDRLLRVFQTAPEVPFAPFSAPDFLDFRNDNRVFDGLAGFNTFRAFTFSGRGESERLHSAEVTANFFRAVGVAPELGRDFTEEEHQPGKQSVAILSQAFWKRRFGANPGILGQAIVLSGKSYSVIGVLPAQFPYPFSDTEVWVPLDFTVPDRAGRDSHWLQVLGRLRPGVSFASAAAQMDTIADRLKQEYPQTNGTIGVKLIPLQERLVGNTRAGLLVLLGAVAFVLLIACGNVANLLLARATVRRREMAVRLALGATRGRLVRQLVTENLLLALAGGFGGLFLAGWTRGILVEFLGSYVPRAEEITVDGRVLWFSLGVSLLTGILFGLAPAFESTRTDVNQALKEGSGSRGATGHGALRSLLVVAEVALSLVVVTGAGLMLRSLANISRVDAGFSAAHVWTAELALPEARYAPDRWAPFYRQVIERVVALPGVASAAMTSKLPLLGGINSVVMIENRPRPTRLFDGPLVEISAVTPNYFRSMEIPLLAGRDLDDHDSASAANVVVINAAMARKFWPGEGGLGKRFTIDEEKPVWREVVGVVGDVRQWGLTSQAIPEMYVPVSQMPVQQMILVARSSGDVSGLAASIRREVGRLDPDLALANARTMERIRDDAQGVPRFRTVLFGLFAGLALVLATLGVYGVISYSVAQRRREMAIRLALGAQRRDVLSIVLGYGLRLTLGGIAAGVLGALALSRVLAMLLYGVTPTDATTLAAVAGVLTVVALAACYIPARRATRVDPLVALRYE